MVKTKRIMKSASVYNLESNKLDHCVPTNEPLFTPQAKIYDPFSPQAKIYLN